MIQHKRECPVVLKGVTNDFGLGLSVPLDHDFRAGLTFIVGESGIGKSTLLHIIAGFVRPSSGFVRVNGDRIPEEHEEAYQRFCRESVVVLHQDRNLIEHMTVAENVALSPIINRDYDGCTQLAERCLQRVGLGQLVKDSIRNLSGGERQRVAIARAMASKAPVVLADEPTGSLDPQRSREVMHLLAQLAQQEGKTVIVVTHDHELAHEHARGGFGEVFEFTRHGLSEARPEADRSLESISGSGPLTKGKSAFGGLQ